MQTTNQAESAGNESNTAAAAAGVKVSRLSAGESKPGWAIGVFAHNEARGIKAALQSVVEAAAGHPVSIYVLANGCTDDTVDKVRSCAATLADLWLVEIPVADKANAWNVFIHDLFTDAQAESIETWFFMDADVTLTPDSMTILESTLQDAQDADGAGGMPGSGRDMDAWRSRMVGNGMLAGNFYLLRDSFVRRIRETEIRMPVGLIGEDFFVSWMIASIVWQDAEPPHRGRCVFSGRAEFMFSPLSLLRLSDYTTYLNRKWRYTLRDLQHRMLTGFLMQQGLESMPATIEELYKLAPLPDNWNRIGILQTPLSLLAARKIRSFRERAAGA
jgi:glycosyltransferase involved in cell wall biosynthesis